MNAIVNGAPRPLDEGTTVAELVAEMGLEGRRIAVELNREIVRRGLYSERRIEDGDHVEIVHFVGGG